MFQENCICYILKNGVSSTPRSTKRGEFAMKCHVIDDRCQPATRAADQTRSALLRDLAEITTRLFRYRFHRARLFEHAASEQARRERS
jgi:hypothetical protein